MNEDRRISSRTRNERGSANQVRAPQYGNRSEGGNQQVKDIEKLFLFTKRLRTELDNLQFKYSSVEKEFFDAAKGKEIVIWLLKGDSFSCSLLDADKYCLYLLVDGRKRMMMKSALSSLEII